MEKHHADPRRRSRNLLDLLARAGVQPGSIAAVTATYALSVLDDDKPVWDALDHLAHAAHPLRVGIADLAVAETATPPTRTAYRLLAALGGADPHREPWKQLALRATLTAHEQRRSGHIHIATAEYPKTGGD